MLIMGSALLFSFGFLLHTRQKDRGEESVKGRVNRFIAYLIMWWSLITIILFGIFKNTSPDFFIYTLVPVGLIQGSYYIYTGHFIPRSLTLFTKRNPLNTDRQVEKLERKSDKD